MSENRLIDDFNKGFEALSKLICFFDIEQKSFNKNIKFHLAHSAKKLFPDKSISDLSLITGISRGMLSDYLDLDTPLRPQDKLALLVTQLWNKKNNKNKLPMHGENSYFSIAKSVLNSHYSPDSALNKLIRLRIIDLEENNIIIKSNKIITDGDDSFYISLIGKVFEKLVDTVISNSISKDKKYQSTFYTDKIPPLKIEQAHNQIFKYLKSEAMPRIRKIIESHEIEDGEFPEYGVSILEFFDK